MASSSGSLAPPSRSGAISAPRPGPSARPRRSREHARGGSARSGCPAAPPSAAAPPQLPVLVGAGAVEQRDGVFDFGVEIIGLRGGLQPARRLGRIPVRAAAFLVERRQRIFGPRTPGPPPAAATAPRRASNPGTPGPRCTAARGCRPRADCRAWRKTPAAWPRSRDPSVCRARPRRHHGKRQHGLAVAAIGGVLVPDHRLLVVAVDAFAAVGVELAE